MSNKFVVEGGLSIPSGKKLELAGVELTGISNDTSLAGASQTEMVTEYAVKSYIDGNNQFTLSDGTNTTSIDSSEVLLASDDNAMTITVSDNGIGFAIDVDDASIEINAQDGLQVKAEGIATGMLAADVVTGAKIADDAVDSEHIAADSLDTEHYAPSSVDTTALGADAVTGAKIADDAIDSEHYAAGSIDNEHIADGVIANVKLVNDTFEVVAGNGLKTGGSASLGSSVTLDLDLNEATAADIDNSADSFLFVDADDNNNTKKESIVDLVAGMDGTGLTAADGSLSVDASQTQITSLGTIGTGVWQGTTIKTAYIEDLNVTTGKLAADAVTGAKIADDSIDSEHIVADSLDTEHYAAGSVDTTALGADAVTGAKIADDTIASEHYAAGSVDTTALGADAVTGAKIADDSLDSEHYAAGSIDNEHIADETIANGKLANSSLTVTAGNGLKTGGEVSLGGTVTLDLDLAEATAADIDNSADSFLFVDADDGNNTKKESIADLVSGMDGTGLTAASGSLSVDATQAQITGIGTSGQMTTFAGTVNVDEAVTMDTTLGVVGVATFTAESVFNGGIDCDGQLSMETNNIVGTADDMLLQSGTIASDYDWSSGTGHMALQSENELVLQSGNRLENDFSKTMDSSTNGNTMFSFDGDVYDSAKVHIRMSDGTETTTREILIATNAAGTSAKLISYGVVSTGANDIDGTFTVTVTDTNTVNLVCTQTVGSTDTVVGHYQMIK